MSAFDSSDFFPPALFARLTELRVTDPDLPFRSAAARIRRTQLAPTGKLLIVAADHPARHIVKSGANPLAMADRRDYLARIVRVLTSPRVDGVMATMDILEDLFALDAVLQAAGAPSLLNGKLLIASLNRGGLAGSAWEMDDPVTGVTPAACQEWHLDGAKFLLRVDLTDTASLKTILAATRAINECSAAGLPMFLEPLPVKRGESGFGVIKTAEALAKLAGVASALGNTSRRLWLKLPYCSGFETVAQSTSLPILLLGGESAEDPQPFLRELFLALRAGPNVRGALVGRNVLYPGAEDPLAVAAGAGGIVHGGWAVEEAMASFATVRGSDMRHLARCVERVEGSAV